MAMFQDLKREAEKERDALRDKIYALLNEFYQKTGVEDFEVHAMPEFEDKGSGARLTGWEIEIPIKI